MIELLRIASRNARASLGRTFMTLVAVCLGVAFLCSSLAVSDTLARNVAVLFSSQYDTVDVVVRGEVIAFGVRADLDEAVVGEVRALDPVAAAAGIVEGFAQPLDLEGAPIGNSAQPGIGRTWVDEPRLQSLPMIAGRGPAGADELVIDSATAGVGGLAVGDRLQITTATSASRFTLVGIADVSSGTGSPLSWFDPRTAQSLLGTEGSVQEVFVAAVEGVDPDTLAGDVAAAMTAETEVLTGAQAAAESQEKVVAAFGFVRVILLVFVGIGLVVCTFIVFNTFAVLTAQRTKQLATLRALGFSRGQVTTATLAEGAMIGLLGSVLGILLGLLGIAALTSLLAALGLGDFSGELVVRPATIALSLAAGLTVTLIGAFPAARHAGRVPPISAMRQAAVAPKAVSNGQVIVAAVLLSLAIMVIGQSAFVGYPDGMAALALGVGILVVGLVAAARPVIIGLVSMMAPAARRLGGLAGELAGRNSTRDSRRTTVTAASLAIGLALVSSLAVLTASTKATLDDAADESLTADILVTPLVGYTPMPATVTDAVRTADDVGAVSPILFDTAVIDAQPTFVTGVDPLAVGDVIALEMIEGDIATLDSGQLLVAESVAFDLGLRVGQEVKALFRASGGTVPLRVGGIFADNIYAGYFMLRDTDVERLTGKSGVWYVYAAAAGGQTPESAKAGAAAALADTANTQVLTRAEYTAYQDELVDQALAGIYFMLLFAVIVALVGVANTVALSVSERTKEIGMLRAVGLTRERVARMIRLEAVMTSVAGAAFGTAVGLYLGVSMREALEPVGFATLAIPWALIGSFFVVSALAGVVAAWLPGRRAARMDVLTAIRGS